MSLVVVLLALSAAPAERDVDAAARVLVARWRVMAPGSVASLAAAANLAGLLRDLGVDPSTEPELLQEETCLRVTLAPADERGTDPRSACEPPREPTAAGPTDDALARALAVLGRERARVRPPRLTRAVLETVGLSDLRYADRPGELRLRALLGRVARAGVDLAPLFQPSLDALEQQACAAQRRAALERLDQLYFDDLLHPAAPGRRALAGPPGYVFEVQATETGALFIARGVGPRKGDVLTTERGYAAPTTDFCTKRRGPPLGAPRPARQVLDAWDRRP